MPDLEKLLTAYEIDVRFPDVSGLEHLDMLRLRSELATFIADLSPEQSMRLQEADKVLLRQRSAFARSIQKIADLADWRRQEKIPSTHWWWYLDVVKELPNSLFDSISSIAA